MHASAQVQDTIARLVPGGESSLSHLSDAELLTGTRRLVGASNKLFAQLLLHLAEVEMRGIHRTRACASLYTYCIYELRMSEDAAARRSSAARLVKRFPLLFEAVARGELHLTGLLMLGPHLTPENHVEVLARAKFRTKKELAKLVRELHPLPQVADLIAPLGPEPRAVREPSWEEWVTSLCPPVRDLKTGDAPRDWANDTVEEAGAAVLADAAMRADFGFTAPARRESPPITPPQQYQMQFSTTEAHVHLVERAKALLARTSPGISLGELHLRAMQLLVARLEKEKFAATSQSQGPRHSAGEDEPAHPEQAEQNETPPHRRGGVAAEPPRAATEAPRQRVGAPPDLTTPIPHQRHQRGRHVPAAVKRQVFTRDAGSCTYVDDRGARCNETHYLELHHVKPFAQGGEHVASNLALRCAAHNALAAEKDFGRDVMEQKRHLADHHSLAAETR